MEKGALIISLDFELLWGVFDKVDWRLRRNYFHNTRELVPKILQLFEKYNVSCTWATVGMLFNENWEEWNTNIPNLLPEYSNTSLSAYQFGREIQFKETEELCFAPNLIAQIKNTPLQEIATHTYSHYYCLEMGQNIDSFRADLYQSINLASKIGVELKSLVFPRNQFNEKYLEICKDLEIDNVRSNPKDWYWKNTEGASLLNKIFRTGDAYIGPSNKSYKLSESTIVKKQPFSQMASRLLRPHSNNKKLNALKLNRIKVEMTKAAKASEFYHLWWHPHNFGNHPNHNLKDLEELLIHFDILRDKYGWLSLNMCETGRLFSLQK